MTSCEPLVLNTPPRSVLLPPLHPDLTLRYPCTSYQSSSM
nr:MAG TPA: hypothetical protein [Caudoviricetes sp.]